jgi:hypothetical protein
MTDITKALSGLNLGEWVLTGTPKNETEFNAMFKKVTGSKDGLAILSSNPSDFGVTWKQVTDKKKVLEDAEPMRLLREERDRLISETDWWASSDLSLTDAQKKYRQDLRDITKTATSLSDVSWPTKPS